VLSTPSLTLGLWLGQVDVDVAGILVVGGSRQARKSFPALLKTTWLALQANFSEMPSSMML